MDRTIVIEDGHRSIRRHAPQPGDRVVDCTSKWITPAGSHVSASRAGAGDIETSCRDAIAGGVKPLLHVALEPRAAAPHRSSSQRHGVGRGGGVRGGGKAGQPALRLPGLRDAGTAMISGGSFTMRRGLLRGASSVRRVGIMRATQLPGPDRLPNEPSPWSGPAAWRPSARVHISHVSTAEGAGIILDAREDGAPITWEICPHHLLLTEDDIERLGAQGKVAPRLKTRRDTEALLQHAIDGEVDALVSDHAPHTDSEKSRPFDQAPPGMLGMGCMMSVSHKALWDKAADPDAWLRAVELWTDGPWSVLGAEGPKIEVGGGAVGTLRVRRDHGSA